MSKAFIKETIIIVAIALLIFTILQFVAKQIVVDGTSMMPNIEEGQRLFVNRTAYLFDNPERGDIVVFQMRGYGDTPLIKRVVGLPGEIVRIDSGIVYVDDIPLNEPYIKDTPDYILQPVTVPKEHYFVLGDNRKHSSDSHQGWTVPQSDLIGQAWFSIWPLETLGIVKNYEYPNE